MASHYKTGVVPKLAKKKKKKRVTKEYPKMIFLHIESLIMDVLTIVIFIFFINLYTSQLNLHYHAFQVCLMINSKSELNLCSGMTEYLIIHLIEY